MNSLGATRVFTTHLYPRKELLEAVVGDAAGGREERLRTGAGRLG